MTNDAARPDWMYYVLFDVDGTLIDAVGNQRRVWGTCAERSGLDADEVYQVALRTRPMDTFAQVAVDHDRPSAWPCCTSRMTRTSAPACTRR